MKNDSKDIIKKLLEKTDLLYDIVKKIQEPIAIVSLDCRFPGDVVNPESYWSLLSDEKDAIETIPQSRWNWQDYYSENRGDIGKMYVNRGGFVGDISQFDANYFQISPKEAELLDPQQRLLLEVAVGALDRGGFDGARLQGSRTGVFIGLCSTDYAHLIGSQQGANYQTIYTPTGNAHSTASGRLSYFFGFEGPNIVVDTACSSSLVGVHLACQSLRLGECDMALAGGVNIMLDPTTTISFCHGHMLSADGKCKTFDKSADGYVRGEGCGMVVLKRLEDAKRDNDTILAVIRGSAVNQDGASSGLTAPNGPAQERVIRAALNQAKLKPEDISFIEAHGTGTELGDPIEVTALKSVFNSDRSVEYPLYLGAVKSNIGHLEGAAGIAGLIKLVLMLQHKKRVKNLHFESINPNIDLDNTTLKVCDHQDDWLVAEGNKRRAGVSSFGFSGTNAHVVLEEAPETSVEEKNESGDQRSWHVLPLSAKTDAALQAQLDQYQVYLEECVDKEISFENICYTASIGRSHFNERVAVVARTAKECVEKIKQQDVICHTLIHQHKPRLAWLFTGQGSQRIKLGFDLYDEHPVFREAIDNCADYLHTHHSYDFKSMWRSDDADLLAQTQHTQLLLFVIEYALAQLWLSFGVKPDYVCGHSVGEYVAAVIAGVMSYEDGLSLVYHRGHLMQSLPAGGGMLVVMSDLATVRAFLKEHDISLAVAGINGPRQIVLSGDLAEVERCKDQLKEQSIRCIRLSVSHAFHSDYMQPMCDAFREVASKIEYQKPQIKLLSNVTGELIKDHQITGDYWVDHILSAVNFAACVKTIEALGCDNYCEIGPDGALIGLASHCVQSTDVDFVASLHKDQMDWRALLHAVATLHVHGVAVDWHSYDKPYYRQKEQLPTYPFQRERYWIETNHKTSQTFGEKVSHPLVIDRLKSPGEENYFRSELLLDTLDYLADHQVYGHIIYPATGFIELMLAVMTHDSGHSNKTSGLCLEDIRFQCALTLDAQQNNQGGVDLQLIRSTENSAEKIVIYSELEQGDWQQHAEAKIASKSFATQQQINIEAYKSKGTILDVAAFYQSLSDEGVYYGPSFQGVKEAYGMEQGVLARIEISSDINNYISHPALLDSCLHTVGLMMLNQNVSLKSTMLPVSVERFQLRGSLGQELWVWLSSEDSNISDSGANISMSLLDHRGDVIGLIEGLQLQAVSRAQLEAVLSSQQGTCDRRDWLYEWQWRELPYEESNSEVIAEETDRKDTSLHSEEHKSHWLLFCESTVTLENISGQLQSACGDDVIIVEGGADFQKHNQSHYTINFSDQKHYQQLFHSFEGFDALQLTDVMVLHPSENNIKDIALQQQQSCISIMYLTQCLVAYHREQRSQQENFKIPQLWLVTQGAQSILKDKQSCVWQTGIWGLGRVIQTEHPELACQLLDIEYHVTDEINTASFFSDEILNHFQRIHTIDDMKENQQLLRSGVRYIGRLCRIQRIESQDLVIPKNIAYQLCAHDSGLLENLEVVPVHLTDDLGEHDVRVQVKSCSLNFRDVLIAMRLYPGNFKQLGGDIAGTVIAVGSKVSSFAVGDEVLGTAPGGLANEVVVSEWALCQRSLSLNSCVAASIPGVWMTVYYSFHDIAKLQKGEKVLIHAATGGVGLAAVRYAQWCGAEIYATAGSERKRLYLRNLGIKHVYDSRSLDYAKQIANDTQGQGVDVVLNSLTGEGFIASSLAVTSQGGRFIELAKRDIWTEEQMSAERSDIAYHIIAIDQLMQEDPRCCSDLLKRVVSWLDDESIQALPYVSYPIERAPEAFRYLQHARHIGKVMITIDDQVDGMYRLGSIRSDATYMITGGLSGLGYEVCKHLIAKGARSLALLSRREPGEEIQSDIAQWQQEGIEVKCYAVDVSDGVALKSCIETIESSKNRLKGVIHCAGILRDATLLKQTAENFQEVFASKVQGGWHLHDLTKHMDLEHFVMFSSIASVMGSGGQANYAAANAFMDGLVQHRRHRGMVGLSINWGAWADVGMALEHAKQHELLGIHGISVEQGLLSLSDVMESDQYPVQQSVLSIDWQTLLSKLFEVPSYLSDLEMENSSSSVNQAELLTKLQKLSESEAIDLLQQSIAQQLAKILHISDYKTIDVNKGFFDLGLDSLMALEFMNHLQILIGSSIKLTPQVSFDYSNISKLTKYMYCSIFDKSIVAIPDDLVDDIDINNISDDEIESILK